MFTEAEEVSKLRVEVEERNKQLQTLVNGTTAENLELKSRVSKMELEHTSLKKENVELKNQQRKTDDELDKIIARLEKQDSELGELKKLIRKRTNQT